MLGMLGIEGTQEEDWFAVVLASGRVSGLLRKVAYA